MADAHQEHNAPYRSMCVGCIDLRSQLEKLRDELALARGAGLYMNQGADRLKHKCVFCGEKLYTLETYREVTKFGYNTVADLWICSEADEIVKVTSGWWIFESTSSTRRNPCCPKTRGITHLHRYCSTCKGNWLEAPIVSGRNRAPAPAAEPQKVHE